MNQLPKRAAGKYDEVVVHLRAAIPFSSEVRAPGIICAGRTPDIQP